jgi:hypothetical protein
MANGQLCEVNNWFLHGGKLLRRAGFDARGSVMAMNDRLFLATAFTLR